MSFNTIDNNVTKDNSIAPRTLTIQQLFEHRAIIFNQPFSLEKANRLLKYAYEYSDINTSLSPELIQIKYELIKLAIHNGANIVNIFSFKSSPWFDDLKSINEIAIANNNTILLTHLLLPLTGEDFFFTEADFEKTQNDTIEKSINNGADVNHEYIIYGVHLRLLDSLVDHNLITLFKKHDAKCGNGYENKYKEEGVYEKLQNIDLRREQLLDNISLKPTNYITKMDTIFHQIWLTNLLNPRELDSLDLECIIKNYDNFFNGFTHILWTNNKMGMPLSIKILEEHGIEVREFSKDIRLYQQITQAISNKEFGIAADALKYVIIEQYGGVYADLNFEFHKNIENEMRIYDFFAQSFSNDIFFAKAHHPILIDLLNEVEIAFETYKNETNIALKTGLITQSPFPESYHKLANSGNNTDLMLPLELHKNITNIAKFHEVCPARWKYEVFLGFSAISNRVGQDGYKGSGMSWLEGGNTERENLFGNNEKNISWELELEFDLIGLET